MGSAAEDAPAPPGEAVEPGGAVELPAEDDEPEEPKPASFPREKRLARPGADGVDDAGGGGGVVVLLIVEDEVTGLAVAAFAE